ncbi:MAG: hypothetical protein CL662_00720 [Bacteroidetes bacterium]|nr:hypothetical protein [Bacteroidota bacterium]|tara:strand:- start:186 stop:491 length:306 start_codon:yes stop_codon:yes gene_type:complete
MNKTELRQIIREEVSRVLNESIDEPKDTTQDKLDGIERVTITYRDGTNKVYSVGLYDKAGERVEKFRGLDAVSDFEEAYNVKMKDLGGLGIKVEIDDFDVS